ncbi:MAG: radical SAM protein [Candidatus Aminicenantes bacterium]|nr:radical SAM protein [Candidatus Aminicenantes bacterium]
MKAYQRFLTPEFKPFDPLELARETEKIVTRRGREGLERKYVGIYSAPVYRGIATGYAAGCCLRCRYCWSNWSRDFPEKFGKFYSPKEITQMLFSAAEKGITAPGWERFRHLKVEKLRLSGCEPTLGKEHLLSVLKYVKDSKYQLFILETNGILLGADKDYVKQLREFKEKLYVRVSFKAALTEGFTQRTGALGEYYELPFKALEYLLNEGIYARAAAMTDPKVMPEEERKVLIEKLNEIDVKANYSSTLEEERIDMYDTTLQRLKAFNDPEFAKKLCYLLRTKRLNTW